MLKIITTNVQTSFTEHTVITVSDGKVLATSVDGNGFEVNDTYFMFSNISPLSQDNILSIRLNGYNMLCVGKSIYKYNPSMKNWTQIRKVMQRDRIGAACLTFGNSVLIFGGCLNGVCSNTIDVMRADLSVQTTGATLPFPVMFHTVTKISRYEFILCGGQNSAGIPVSDVYFGTFWLCGLSNLDTWEVCWVKLPDLNIRRWNHTSLYMKNRLIVAGGSSQINRLVNEVGVVGSTILRQYSELEDFAGADIEQLKFKKTFKSTKAYEFVRTDGSKSYLPFSTSHKGWKRCKVTLSSK